MQTKRPPKRFGEGNWKGGEWNLGMEFFLLIITILPPLLYTLHYGKKTFIETSKLSTEKWADIRPPQKYTELEKIRLTNSEIERAKKFKESYTNKIRGFEADRDIAISSEEKAIATERTGISNTIERLKAEIIAAQDKLKTLDSKLEDKKAIAIAKYNEQVAKLDGDIQIADKYADKQPIDTTELMAEINTAEAMKLHINEYRRMAEQQKRNAELLAGSEEYTRKIELARELPAEILKTAKIPVDGLTVENGIPLINGLPISNLRGENSLICVDVSYFKA